MKKHRPHPFIQLEKSLEGQGTKLFGFVDTHWGEWLVLHLRKYQYLLWTSSEIKEKQNVWVNCHWIYGGCYRVATAGYREWEIAARDALSTSWGHISGFLCGFWFFCLPSIILMEWVCFHLYTFAHKSQAALSPPHPAMVFTAFTAWHMPLTGKPCRSYATWVLLVFSAPGKGCFHTSMKPPGSSRRRWW